MKTRNGDKAVTIHDVAHASQVSIATVSYVINNGPRNVRPETRDRVLAAIEQLRYRPNALARSLVSRRTDTIGLISNRFPGNILLSNYYSLGVFDGVLRASELRGYNVIVFTQPWENREESEWLSERKTDGLVILAPSLDSNMVNTLEDMNIPLVGVGADSLRLGIPTVDVDNFKGAMLAVEHLIGLGHRKIAHLVGTRSQSSADVRLEAYRRVMATHGLKVPDEYVVEIGYEAAGVIPAIDALLTGSTPPTAIFAASDSIARSTIQTASSLGISVPEKLSVIGYDDAPFAADMHPGLTTIRQPLRDIGGLAVDLLLRQRRGEEVDVRTHLLTPELVVRGTTDRNHG